MARLSLTSSTRPLLHTSTTIPRFLAPAAIAHQARTYAAGVPPRNSSNKQKDKKENKKRVFKTYRVDKLDKMQQFTLCDAIRYAPTKPSRSPLENGRN